MAVGIRGTTPLVVGNTGNPISGTLTGARQPVVDDWLYIIHGNNFFNLSNMPTPTVGGSTSGVTLVTQADGGADNAHVKTYRFKVTVTGDVTIEVTETGSGDEEKAIIAYVLSGVDGTTPLDGTPAGGFGGPSITHTAPSVDGVTTTDGFMICHTNTGGGSSSGSYTPPAGMSEQYDQLVGGGMSMAGATQQLILSGNTGTKIFTSGSTAWAAVSAVFRAASGGALVTSRRPRIVVSSRKLWTPPPLIRKTRVVDLSIVGSVAGVLASPTAQFAGSALISGDLVGVLPAGVGQMSGTVDASGTIAATLPALSGQLTGSLELSGSIAGVLSVPVAQMTGVTEISGVLSASFASLTGQLLGASEGLTSRPVFTIVRSPSGRVRQGAETIILASPREIPSGVVGVISATIASPTSAMAGSLSVTGTASGTLSSFSSTLSGVVDVPGVLTAILTSPSTQMSGTVQVDGVLSATIGSLAGAMTGNVAIAGSVSSDLLAAQTSFSGLVFANVLVATLPVVQGSIQSTVSSSGSVSGSLPLLTSSASGVVGVVGSLTGALSVVTGSMTGEIDQPTGPLAGVLAGLLGALSGTSDAEELGSLSIALPALVAGYTWPTQREEELIIHRLNTWHFIQVDPMDVALIPNQRSFLPSGGWKTIALPARAVQRFRLIPMSHTERVLPSSARKHDFTLLGTWDAVVDVLDEWEDSQGDRYIVDALIPYNGYQRKALITKYVEK